MRVYTWYLGRELKFFFFFKQKTAYEMRISDWSSDVCSSDLLRLLGPNSIGLANVHSGAILSVNAVFESDDLLAGGLSLVSQSGSMMGSLLSRAAARGFGFAKTVSVEIGRASCRERVCQYV